MTKYKKGSLRGEGATLAHWMQRRRQPYTQGRKFGWSCTKKCQKIWQKKILLTSAGCCFLHQPKYSFSQTTAKQAAKDIHSATESLISCNFVHFGRNCHLSWNEYLGWFWPKLILVWSSRPKLKRFGRSTDLCYKKISTDTCCKNCEGVVLHNQPTVLRWSFGKIV